MGSGCRNVAALWADRIEDTAERATSDLGVIATDLFSAVRACLDVPDRERCFTVGAVVRWDCFKIFRHAALLL